MMNLLIYISLILKMSSVRSECPDQCVCNGTELECKNTLPSFIPENVTMVTVREVPLEPYMNFTYTDWQNVTYFSLTLGDVVNSTVNLPSRTLQDYEFVGLTNVEHLKILCHCFLKINSSALYGLPDVRILDLSHNVVNLILNDIIPGLAGHDILPNLSELHLSNITYWYNPDWYVYIYLDRLHTAMENKPLQVLDLSDTNVRFYIYNISHPPPSILPQLHTLNISRAEQAFYTLPIWIYQYYTERPEAVFSNLQVLDASYPDFPVTEVECRTSQWPIYWQFCDAGYSEHNVLPNNLTELYLPNIFQSTLQELRGTNNNTHVCIVFSYFTANNTICIRTQLDQLQKLDISNNLFTYIQPDFIQPLKRLKYLNISYNKLGPALADVSYARSFFQALQSTEVLIFCHNNITVIPRDALTHLRNLKIVDLSYNELTSVDFGINHLESLEIVDLSYNKIVTVNTWSYLKHLRILDLSQNQLTKVNFGINPLESLEVINLSYNKISMLNTFAYVRKLQILNLSHNQLTSLDFGMDRLDSLQMADLSYNKLVTVTSAGCDMLKNLHFNPQLSNTSIIYTNKTGLRLEGNPISCSCDNLCLFNFLLYQVQNETNICYQNDETKNIEFSFLRNFEYSCKDTIVKAAFTMDAIATIIVIGLATYVMKKERERVRLKRLKESGIEQYGTGRNKYAAFLSFSGDDEDFVMTRVYPQLEAGLKKILKTESDCVATGGTHFRPGHSIQDEIVRCVEESSVVIFFLSDTFINKPWCRSEVHKAFCDEKPIILMILGKLNMKSMPRVLRKHYETFTRVHWCLENGEYVMRPNMEHFCDTIVGLMGKKEPE